MKNSFTLFVLFFLFLGRGSFAQNLFPDTFGSSASPQALTGFLNDIILPIVNDIIYDVGVALPDSCCYSGLGLSGTRLYLENLGIPEESINSSGSIQTSPRGMFVQTDGEFNVTFYLHICEEALNHCTTILHCKGDANVHFTTNLRMLLNIYPDVNGQPVVQVDDFFFHLAAPEKVGLCNFVDIFLDTLIPLINDAVNLAGPRAIDNGVTALLHAIPQTIDVSGESFFDFHWAMTNTTGSSDLGSSLMFDLEVLVKSMADAPGPYVADPSIPNALLTLEGPGALGLDFSDSILSNIFYSIFTEKNPAISTNVDGFDVTVTFPTSPYFHFTNLTGLDSASLTLSLKVLLKKSILRITAHATAIAHFEVIILPEGKLTIQLNPNDLDVTITSTSPPTTNDTKTSITQSIEDSWASSVPGINQQLLDNAFSLPHIADFNNPYISYGNGYAAIGFDTISTSNLDLSTTKLLERLVQEVTRPIGDQMLIKEEEGKRGKRVGASCPNLGAQPIECETPRMYDL